MAREALSFIDMSREGIRSGSPWGPLAVRLSMGGRSASKIVTFHRSGKTLPFRNSSHIHVISSRESIHLKGLADCKPRRVVRAKFSNPFGRRDPCFLENTRSGFTEGFFSDIPKSDL